MPNNSSAKKRLRSSARQRMVNKMRKSKIKTNEARLLEKIVAKDLAAAKAELGHCFSELDKAAKKGTLHRNTVNRKKQRLALRVQALDL